MGKLISLSVGNPKSYNWNGKEEMSAIGKGLINEVFLGRESFRGDAVANTDFHGGPDRAVCLYPFEHYEQWEKEFERSFVPPAFGENICVSGAEEKDVFIGDTYSLGNTIIQVTQGRIPCSSISKFNEVNTLLKRIVETGFTGYFFRVLQEGTVYKDSKLSLIDRKQEKFTIMDLHNVIFHDPKNESKKKAIIAIPELAEAIRDRLHKKLDNLYK